MNKNKSRRNANKIMETRIFGNSERTTRCECERSLASILRELSYWFSCYFLNLERLFPSKRFVRAAASLGLSSLMVSSNFLLSSTCTIELQSRVMLSANMSITFRRDAVRWRPIAKAPLDACNNREHSIVRGRSPL